MERKELKAYTGDHIYNVLEYAEFKDPCFDANEFLIKSEADAVLDAQEAKIKGLEYKLHLANKRIKDLENGVQHSKEVQESLKFELSRRSSRIKELEAQRDKLENKITELEDELDEQETK